MYLDGFERNLTFPGSDPYPLYGWEVELGRNCIYIDSQCSPIVDLRIAPVLHHACLCLAIDLYVIVDPVSLAKTSIKIWVLRQPILPVKRHSVSRRRAFSDVKQVIFRTSKVKRQSLAIVVALPCLILS